MPEFDWQQIAFAIVYFMILWPLAGIVAWLLMIAIYVHPRDYWRQKHKLLHPWTLVNKSTPGFIALVEFFVCQLPTQILGRVNGTTGWVDFDAFEQEILEEEKLAKDSRDTESKEGQE